MRRFVLMLAVVLLCLAPTASRADLMPYSQDFEGLLDTTLDQPAQVALANDGWLVFVNLFDPNFIYFGGYGPFPAPNGGFGGPAFSAVVVGEGGSSQGDQQLSVYSNYNDGNHGVGNFVEANVFQEQIISAADVGSTWVFEFDYKLGNLTGFTTAAAFIKTLDPNAGFVTTNFITADMTTAPTTWESTSLSIYIDPSLAGQILQIGFNNTTTFYEGSGVFYDNINFDVAPLSVDLDIKPGSCPNPINARSRGVIPAAVLGTMDFDVYDIDVSTLQLAGVAPVNSSYEDVAEPYTGEPCGCAETGPDGWLDLTLKFKTQDIVAAIGAGSGEHVLTLTGALLDGTSIEGLDCVVFVGGGRSPRSLDVRRATSRRSRLAGDGSGGTSLRDLQAD